MIMNSTILFYLTQKQIRLGETAEYPATHLHVIE